MAMKKGLFYSLTAIILLGFLTYGVMFSTKYSYTQEMFVVKNRVNAMNTYLEDLQKDMDRATFIIGFRTLLAMQQHILESGDFFTSTADTFSEAFLNGTIDGESVLLMNHSTFPNWTTRMGSEAAKIKLNVAFEVQDVEITQEVPWEVKVTVTSRINLTDDLGTAQWNSLQTATGSVNIFDFEDPLYIVYTDAQVPNTFRKSPYDNNFTSGTSTANLRAHINASYYITTNSSPSFLMRFEGNLSDSEVGVESIVNLLEFQAASQVIKNATGIDYLYFGTLDFSNVTLGVNNTFESWFRIDNSSGHLQRYMVENLTFDP